MSKPTIASLRAFAAKEHAEARAQLAEWQQRLAAAQQQAQSAQQAGQQAQAMIFKAEGAVESLAAILAAFADEPHAENPEA
jgi:chromosome segregation ATPase